MAEPGAGDRRPSPWPSGAGELWREQLAAWAIPPEILAEAPESPYGFLPEMFVPAQEEPVDTPSRRRAIEALPPGGTVLDAGCGGGRASLALVPPAGRVVGVDESPEMLELFRASTARRGVEAVALNARLPSDAALLPCADVVVCHHLAYNVADLAALGLALGGVARRRVVVELSERHPLEWMRPLWRRFWGLELPEGPDAALAAEVLAQAGLPVRCEPFDDPRDVAPGGSALGAPRGVSAETWVRFTRRRLCLTPDRDPEVAEALARLEPRGRRLVALWWDTAETAERAGGPARAPTDR